MLIGGIVLTGAQMVESGLIIESYCCKGIDPILNSQCSLIKWCDVDIVYCVSRSFQFFYKLFYECKYIVETRFFSTNKILTLFSIHFSMNSRVTSSLDVKPKPILICLNSANIV